MKYQFKPNRALVVEAHVFKKEDQSTHSFVNQGWWGDVSEGETVADRHWCGSFQKPREVRDGDWIVHAGKGIVFACAPAEFEKNYEPFVEEPAA